MKLILLSSLLFSGSLMASDCEKQLLSNIEKNPNIKIVKTHDLFECGLFACAVTFEHDSSPYPNLKVLAFLDPKNGVKVDWAPIHENRANGWETIKKSKTSYVDAQILSENEMRIKESIETKRDSIFWPPHKVYFEKTTDCRKH